MTQQLGIFNKLKEMIHEELNPVIKRIESIEQQLLSTSFSYSQDDTSEIEFPNSPFPFQQNPFESKHDKFDKFEKHDKIEKFEKLEMKNESKHEKEIITEDLMKKLDEKVNDGIDKMKKKYSEIKKNAKLGYDKNKKRFEEASNLIKEIQLKQNEFVNQIESIQNKQISFENELKQLNMNYSELKEFQENTISKQLNEKEINSVSEKVFQQKIEQIEKDIFDLLKNQTQQMELYQSISLRIDQLLNNMIDERSTHHNAISNLRKEITTEDLKVDEIKTKMHQMKKGLKSKEKKQNEFENKMNMSLTQLQSSMQIPFANLTDEQLFFSIERYNKTKQKIDQFDLTINQITILEQWMSKSIGKPLFDSEKDNWENETSTLNEKLFGKKNVLFLIEDEDNEKFGYYFSGSIGSEIGDIPAEKDSFVFNIQSKEKRLKKPKKWNIVDCNYGIELFENKNSYHFLIRLGDIFLKNKQCPGNCCQQENEHFDYGEIPNVLCGKTLNDGGCFSLKRLIVIQTF